MRRVFGWILIVSGGMYTTIMPAWSALSLFLYPSLEEKSQGESSLGILLIYIAINWVIAVGLLAGGIALRGWHRRRKVFGIVLVIGGSFSLVFPLMLLGQIGISELYAGDVFRLHNCILAGLGVGLVFGAVMLPLGVRLVLVQRRLDLSVTPGRG